MTSNELRIFCDIINACNLAGEMKERLTNENSLEQDKLHLAITNWEDYIIIQCRKLSISVVSCQTAAAALQAQGFKRVKPTQCINFFHR